LWCHGRITSGGVVDSGTTVASPVCILEGSDTTTTGRTFTISGGANPLSKLHINTIPGRGWKVIGMMGLDDNHREGSPQ
jgi:hypothetical protein